jgi:hypothetical protein
VVKDTPDASWETAIKLAFKPVQSRSESSAGFSEPCPHQPLQARQAW